MKSASGKRDLAGALRAIGEQQRSGGANPAATCVDRLDHAGLIVDELDCDQRRPRRELRVRAPSRSTRCGSPPHFGFRAHRGDDRIARSDRQCDRRLGPRGDDPIASLAPEVRMTS